MKKSVLLCLVLLSCLTLACISHAADTSEDEKGVKRCSSNKWKYDPNFPQICVWHEEKPNDPDYPKKIYLECKIVNLHASSDLFKNNTAIRIIPDRGLIETYKDPIRIDVPNSPDCQYMIDLVKIAYIRGCTAGLVINKGRLETIKLFIPRNVIDVKIELDKQE